jgi:hypothetical protein
MKLFKWAMTDEAIRLSQVRRIQRQTTQTKRAQLAYAQMCREILESQGVKTAPPISPLQMAIASGRKNTVYLRDGKMYEAPKMRAFLPAPVAR